MGHAYYNFGATRAAECLDSECFSSIPPEEWRELRRDGTAENPGILSNFLFEEDFISPAEMSRRNEPATPVQAARRGGGRGAHVAPVRVLTPEEEALEGLTTGLALSEINPLHAEFKDYVILVMAIPVAERSTLGFWKTHGLKFPILRRIARRVLCSSATSCDVERLFSRAGLICTALRNRLAPKTTQCLTTLHYYYADEEKQLTEVTARDKATAGRANRFATLSTDLLINAAEYFISDSDSDAGDF